MFYNIQLLPLTEKLRQDHQGAYYPCGTTDETSVRAGVFLTFEASRPSSLKRPLIKFVRHC